MFTLLISILTNEHLIKKLNDIIYTDVLQDCLNIYTLSKLVTKTSLNFSLG